MLAVNKKVHRFCFDFLGSASDMDSTVDDPAANVTESYESEEHDHHGPEAGMYDELRIED
jgi:hypothetical protein